jgi:pantoate--beta-alanine ligase
VSVPRLVHEIAGVRALIADARRRGRAVAFVATMGALHEGHLSLVRRASEQAPLVIVSIFVNPLQFGAGEDLDKYPRTLDADVEALAGLGLSDRIAVFAPTADEMYPSGPTQTRVTAGPVGDQFEGATRPGHFDGMLTVVAKLFGIVQPDVAVFGQKDGQQVFLVRQMVADLNLPLRLDIAPTVRDDSGLALSSRNRYLDEQQARAALVLSGALAAAEASAVRGVTAATDAALAVLHAEPLAELDYFALVDPDTFRPLGEGHSGAALALIAARLGSTRLIDNRALTISAGT